MDFVAFIFISLISIFHVIYYNTLKKKYNKAENLNIFFHSIFCSVGKNFYFKDFIKRTEYCRLYYNNSEFESLEKFLEQFHKTKEILELVNVYTNKDDIKKNFKYKIVSKNKETIIELSISYITDKNNNIIGVGILFYDISEYEINLQNITNNFNKIKTENQNYSAILKLSPYIIWKENNKKITILSEKFKSIINEINQHNSFKELESKSLKIIEYNKYLNVNNKIKLYHITKLYKNNSYFCFAHDTSMICTLEEQIFGYEDMTENLLNNITSAAIFINTNFIIKSFNNLVIKNLQLPNNFFSNEKGYWELLNYINETFNFTNIGEFISSQQKETVLTEKNETTYTFFSTEKGNILKQTAIQIKNVGCIILLNWEDNISITQDI